MKAEDHKLFKKRMVSEGSVGAGMKRGCELGILNKFV